MGLLALRGLWSPELSVYLQQVRNILVKKLVIADLKQIIDKSVQSENDEYQGQSMMKAMTKVADLMIRYQKEVKEEEDAIHDEHQMHLCSS